MDSWNNLWSVYKLLMRVERLGYLSPFGFSRYYQKVEKKKKVFYNRVEAIEKVCGTKINIVVGGKHGKVYSHEEGILDSSKEEGEKEE
jgi:hypothetical protein